MDKSIIQQQFYKDCDKNKYYLNRVETFDLVVGTQNYLFNVDGTGQRKYKNHGKHGKKRYVDPIKVVEMPLNWKI